ncbi:glutamate-5-semialdehyde dehydrogenase [Deminuibacter soli]|uniref:Gamma-glutamyl phosphate reductase n=2 Tax=Deminuibacter soli TaxID=2291815 RepID=A0A3E1NHT5_9BACT|nr:glutamate-5-semialdehyde dehydrogenase [Deminuibacter soli]
MEANYIQLFNEARAAADALSLLDTPLINRVLNAIADKVTANVASILEANRADLERMHPENPMYDRLLLNEARIQGMAAELRHVAQLPSPLQAVLSEQVLPNGLQLSRISVPLGVIGIIYEARPNVTLDAFSLCFKTGNAVLLKGGTDAHHSNLAIVQLIHSVLQQYQLPQAAVTLLPPERISTETLLQATGYVDVVIPRGSQQLIDFVRKNARVPVIETGAGIVHTFIDATADTEKSKAIILNAKTRRVSVCNALDCLLVHEEQLIDLPNLLQPLAAKNVKLYADERAYVALQPHYPADLLAHATEEHYGTEFLSLQMAVKTVADIHEALQHIQRFSSKHSEAIVSQNKNNIALFLRAVDAAAVYANASTAFTDGAQFGLGAEIGISTQKLHARGPMALQALTSYKWIVVGDGQVRL